MRSPFAIFRKHQKVFLVVLTGLAMFAFIFLDQISQSGGQGMIPILGLIVGAGVFWIIGTQTGKPSEYAVAGAIIGLAVGWVLPGMGSVNAAVYTDAGDLTQRELQDLVNRRRTANNFVSTAYMTSSPFGELANNPQFAPFIQQQMRQFMFQIDPNRPVAEDVVLGHLLEHEAKEQGIIISDAAVDAYIKRVTSNNLTQEAFRTILSRMRIRAEELFDVLRAELRIQLAGSLKTPRATRTPAEYWKDYRKLNVTQSIDVTAIPVERFVGEISDPSDSVLKEFFESHKELFPNQESPGTPGFRQPRKVQLAFLEADYVAIEEGLDEITDKEVTEHYEANKDTLYLNNSSPDFNFPMDLNDDKSEGDSTKGEGEKTEGKQEGPELNPPKTNTPEEKKPESEKPESEKPAEPEKKEDAKPEAPKTEKPKTEESKPEESKPEEKKESADEKGEDESESVSLLDVINDLPVSAVDSLNASENLLAVAALRGNFDEKAAADEEKPAAKKEEPAKEEAKPEEPKKEDKKPAADTKKPEEPKKESTEPDAKPDEKKADPDKDAKPEEKKESDDKKPEIPPFPAPAEDGKEKKEEKPKYRPLDEVLQGEIRDTLLRERAMKIIGEKIRKAYETMSELGAKHTVSEGGQKLTEAEVAEQLGAYALKEGLHYEKTTLLGYRDLSESEDYPIGSAVEIVNPAMRSSAASVADRIFSNDSDELYRPETAEDPLDNNRFAYWVVQHSKEHVPTLNETGIREEVVKAWKLQKALPKAQERAEAIATIINENEKEDTSIFDLLENETVTGKKDGLKLTVSDTPPFSWFTQSFAPSQNPFGPRAQTQVQLSSIPNVEKAGNDFMERIFTAEENKALSVANADKSIVYVVVPKTRSAGEGGSAQAMRQQFIQNGVFGSQSMNQLSDRDRFTQYLEWMQDLEESYNVQWTDAGRAIR